MKDFNEFVKDLDIKLISEKVLSHYQDPHDSSVCDPISLNCLNTIEILRQYHLWVNKEEN